MPTTTNGSHPSHSPLAKHAAADSASVKPDEVDVAFTEPQSSAKRGRKAGTVALSVYDRLQLKRAELERARAEERDLARAAAERIVSIVGRALLGQAQRDPGFKVSLVSLLGQAKLTPGERRELAHLLDERGGQ